MVPPGEDLRHAETGMMDMDQRAYSELSLREPRVLGCSPVRPGNRGGVHAVEGCRSASRAAARLVASVRRACPAAIRAFISASTSFGAVSGEPELNGGAGLYSSRS